MRVPGRWVVSLGLTMYATGCLPSTSSVSLSPPTRADLTTVAAESPGSRPSDSAPVPAQKKANKKLILIGAAVAVLIVAVILIAGGDDYHPPGTDEHLVPIR